MQVSGCVIARVCCVRGGGGVGACVCGAEQRADAYVGNDGESAE
jgi:hypothetical protein